MSPDTKVYPSPLPALVLAAGITTLLGFATRSI
ncbi:hypothetical protein A6302_03035 [Methylobrevis pamukkalensis]|uniref:Uncharacterized protein n=1 Tax=Methylobrevis pamukkalensis TaxID=1439726 RepID=A0A1E3H022_9HYPH|nr:hypothetical protein A6302_03035 [Methylobrevis pamukkalensis]